MALAGNEVENHSRLLGRNGAGGYRSDVRDVYVSMLQHAPKAKDLPTTILRPELPDVVEKEVVGA